MEPWSLFSQRCPMSNFQTVAVYFPLNSQPGEVASWSSFLCGSWEAHELVMVLWNVYIFIFGGAAEFSFSFSELRSCDCIDRLSDYTEIVHRWFPAGRLNVLFFSGFISHFRLSQIDCSLFLVAEVLSLRSTTWGEWNGNMNMVFNIILAFSCSFSLHRLFEICL